MKKKLLLILIILLMPIFASAKDFYGIEEGTLEEALDTEKISHSKLNYNKDGINIYLFWGNGCPHCHDFLEFASTTLIEEKGDLINFVTYEVWYNDDNSDLLKEVGKYMKFSVSGVPTIIIGDTVINGYSNTDSFNNKIYNAIDKEYEAEKKTDVVKKILSDDYQGTEEEEEIEPLIPDDDTKEGKTTFKEQLKKFYEENKTSITILAIGLIASLSSIIIIVVLILLHKSIKKQDEKVAKK